MGPEMNVGGSVPVPFDEIAARRLLGFILRGEWYRIRQLLFLSQNLNGYFWIHPFDSCEDLDFPKNSGRSEKGVGSS